MKYLLRTEKLGKQILSVLNEIPITSTTCTPVLNVLHQTTNFTNELFEEQTSLLTMIQNSSVDAREALFNVTVNLNFSRILKTTSMSAYPAILNISDDVYGNRSAKTVIIENPNPRHRFKLDMYHPVNDWSYDYGCTQVHVLYATTFETPS